MEITASQVKDLREKTGAGMLDCKKALAETAGDFEKAVEYLRKKGIANAAKKAGRATKDGTVASFITSDGKSGAVVEINCETDFVARTEQFKTFVKNVGDHVLAKKPNTVEALMNQAAAHDGSKNMDACMKEMIATLGENMSVRRFAHFEASGNGFISSYIHGEGKVGVLVEFTLGNPGVANNEAFKTYARDVAMHIAAAMPQYVRPGDIPASVIEKEKEIAVAQMAAQNKPQAVLEKIAEGKIKKFYEEVCLIHQPFVKNPDQTIEALTQSVAKAAGGEITIKQFARFALGEGMKDESAENVH